jgi:hypothetical protein
MGPPGSVVRCVYCRCDNRMAGLTGAMPILQPAVHPPVGQTVPATPEQQRFVRRIILFVIAVTVLPPLLIAFVWIVVAAIGVGTALFLEYQTAH